MRWICKPKQMVKRTHTGETETLPCRQPMFLCVCSVGGRVRQVRIQLKVPAPERVRPVEFVYRTAVTVTAVHDVLTHKHTR